jgi:hypothetical protein
MKFHCKPENGLPLNKNIASANIRKALLEEETAQLDEVEGGIMLIIENAGRKTRERVLGVLDSALGMTYEEVAEAA